MILFSNRLSKNYSPVEQGELRGYTKARHDSLYKEELDEITEEDGGLNDIDEE